MEYRYYVYILVSKSRTLYIGITNNLAARLREHRSGINGGFTDRYRLYRLVYYEVFTWVQDAIAREKQLKRWRREKKVALIERENPTWERPLGGVGQARGAEGPSTCHLKEQQVPPLGLESSVGMTTFIRGSFSPDTTN